MKKYLMLGSEEAMDLCDGKTYRGVKLLNRRVMLCKQDGNYYMIFKNLPEKETSIALTPLALSEEAMDALFSMYCEISKGAE